MTTITIIQIYPESAYRPSCDAAARKPVSIGVYGAHSKPFLLHLLPMVLGFGSSGNDRTAHPCRLSGTYLGIVVGVTGFTLCLAVYAGLLGM